MRSQVLDTVEPLHVLTVIHRGGSDAGCPGVRVPKDGDDQPKVPGSCMSELWMETYHLVFSYQDRGGLCGLEPSLTRPQSESVYICVDMSLLVKCRGLHTAVNGDNH